MTKPRRNILDKTGLVDTSTPVDPPNAEKYMREYYNTINSVEPTGGMQYVPTETKGSGQLDSLLRTFRMIAPVLVDVLEGIRCPKEDRAVMAGVIFVMRGIVSDDPAIKQFIKEGVYRDAADFEAMADARPMTDAQADALHKLLRKMRRDNWN